MCYEELGSRGNGLRPRGSIRVAKWASGRVTCSGASSQSFFRGRGFSLVEMMVVLILIGLLASVVTINVRGYLVRGRQDTARMELATIRDALETYYGLVGRYPTSEEGIASLARASERIPEPILQQLPDDPWGRPYQYHSPGRDNHPYDVICYGADGREGGGGPEGDLTCWDRRGGNSKENP